MTSSGSRWSITARAFASFAAFASIVFFMACGADRISGLRPTDGPAFNLAGTGIVISQMYGGGGNSGATYKNDFIELYNPGPSTVSLTGWTVQYASAAGTTWATTALNGSIAPGQYYLIQEAVGAGGTTSLPTPDATGAIAMSATAGKVALVSSTTALTGACPLAGTVDYVGFGSTTCFEGSGPTPTLSNTAAALRKSGGLIDTDNNAADFSVGAPTPRNTGAPPVNVLAATIAPVKPSILPGATKAFTVTAAKGTQSVAVTSAAWTSSDPAIATIDATSGVATGVAPGTTLITVSASTASEGSATDTTTLTVAAPSTSGALFISQVYGGGGNSGATLKNDYIELYNPGTTAVNLAGWSVQYSNATAAGWLVTTKTDLSGIVPAGHYFLIQEAAGAGGSTDLVAPDFVAGAATGTNAISIGGTSGKVALVSSTTLLSGNCPKADPTVVDFVGYGLADCFKGTGATAVLSNTTAAVRKDYGRTNTNDNAADFEADFLTPHNSSATPPTVGAPTQVVMSPTSWSLNVNQTKAFTAKALDANSFRVYAATFTWTTGDATIATVDANGLATARKVGTTSVNAATSGVATPGTATIEVTPVAGTIVVQARTNPLPVGFQTQLFLSSGVDANGNPVGNADVTWSSATPGIASVNAATGVLTANGVGQAVITATAKSDGISKGSTTVVTNNPSVDPNARIGHNTDLGTPTDADPSDDIIIARRQYTTSYNPRRGVANWVSWNLDASHKGSVLRCNCFTADTALARFGLPAYETSDWINNGSNGQYSRGHMSPSADWQISDGDNAPTFFLTNMLPQNQAINGGVWGNFENYLRTRAVGTAELYIISGGIFTKDRSGPGVDGYGTISNAGKIAIPDSIWKVVVILPDGRPASDITSPSDVEVIAVNMPNDTDPAHASAPYTTYYTTIDRIQKSTGYDLLAILPEGLQCRLEARNCAPAAHITGSGLTGGAEGQTLAFDASTSSDQESGTALTYAWSVDGQVVGTAATLAYAFPDNGTYQLRLAVTDGGGATAVETTSVVVTNVAPSVGGVAAGSADEGSPYAASGSFTDPGDDHWSATVDYGDGSGAQPLTLSGQSFTLGHTYAASGQYTVTITVRETDSEAASGTQTATVTVANVAPVVAQFDGATILVGESYGASGGFADPGVDSWTGTVSYGDGAPTALALAGKTFALQHTYTSAGAKTVTVTVTDGDGGSGARTALVTVLTPGQGIAALASQVAALAASGAMDGEDAKWIAGKLDVAAKELARGNVGPARNQLLQTSQRLEAEQRAGRLSSGDAAALSAYLDRVIAALGTA